MLKQLFFIPLIFCAATLFAQEDEEPKESRWFTGGTFGFSFGSNAWNVSLSPQLGYRFTKHLAAGAGVNLQYFSSSLFYTSRRTVTGLNVFGRVYPFRYLMLQVQPEVNYVWGKDIYDNPREVYKFKEVMPNLLVGGGAVLPSGGGEYIIGVFYDALQANTFYGKKPFLRIMVNVGL